MPGIRVRRILKVLGWAGGVGVVLVLVAGLWIRLAFPPERIRRLAIARLETALRRPVQMEGLSFRLLRGIEARGVQIGPASTAVGGLPLFRADRILLTYDLSALWRRRLKITHLRIDAPHLSVRQGPDGRLDVEDLLTPTPASGRLASDSSTSPFPLLLQLDLVEVQGVSLSVTSERDQRWLRLGGLDAMASGIALPSWDRATLSARVAGHPLTVEAGSLSDTLCTASIKLQFDLKVQLKDSAALRVEGDGSISSRVRQAGMRRLASLPDAGFYVKARADLDSGQAEVEGFRASLGRAAVLSMEGKVRDLRRNPDFEFAITEGRVDLREAWAAAQDLIHSGVLPDLPAEVRGMSVSGSVETAGTRLRGTLGTATDAQSLATDAQSSATDARSSGVTLDGRIALSDLQLTLPQRGLSISQGDLAGRISVASVAPDSSGAKKAHLSVDSLRVAALRLALNDTTRVEAEGLSFEGHADYEAPARQMKAEARAGLVRVRWVAGGEETAASGAEVRIGLATTDRGGYRGQMEGRVASLLRGQVAVGLSATVEDTTRDGGPDWTKARCKGRVAWSGLDLGQVPDTGLRGQADLSADIQAQGAEDLSVGLDVKAPALRYGSGDSARSLPPIHLLADLTGGATPSRRGFYIKRLTSEINEKTVEVEVAGGVSEGGLKIDLRRAEVDVSRAAALIEGLTGPLGGSVSGTVGLSGSVTAPPGRNGLTGDLRVRLKGIRADLPGLRLTAEGVGGEGSAALRADSLSVGVAVRAGRIAKSDLEALKDGLRGAGLSADVRCATPDSGGVLRALTTRGRVDVAARAEATLPEIGGRFKAVGTIGDIFRKTLADIRLEASLAPSDSLSVGGVEVAGSVGVEARAVYDSGAGRASVDGRLSFGHLRLRSSSGLALDDLHGVVPFSQGIDLAGRRLIRETGDEPGGRSAPAAVPYSYVRAYYDRSKVRRPGLSLRRVEVRDAKTGALYRAGDVDAHLIVRDGGLTAPYFSLRAYEGDVAGSLRLDFGSVDPTQPDLSGLRYEVEVQVARLNASLLTDRARVSRGDATVSADVHLKGNGLPDYRDAFGPFDVSGACHVTRIGPAAADHLLRQMDLDETDVDVQYYRRLIRQGWNFRSLAVELRHGFVYVSGQLTKPRWMPFNIPASQISRVPIRYLLTPEVREEAGQ